MRYIKKKKVLRYTKRDILRDSKMERYSNDYVDILKEQRKIYNKRYYEKHKELRLDRLWCGYCHGTFNSYNKSCHFRTQKHRKAEDEGV